jgi:hypothetical protein
MTLHIKRIKVVTFTDITDQPVRWTDVDIEICRTQYPHPNITSGMHASGPEYIWWRKCGAEEWTATGQHSLQGLRREWQRGSMPVEPMSLMMEERLKEIRKPAAAEPDITPEWLLEVGGEASGISGAIWFRDADNSVAVFVHPTPQMQVNISGVNEYTCCPGTFTRDRFRALAFGLEIQLKGEG